jgi:hypothetical protein
MTRAPRLHFVVGPLVLAAASLAPACSTGVDLGGTAAARAGAGYDATTCAAFAAPGTSAPCDACKQGDNGCQENGCFNGYLCDSTERDCKAPGTPCVTGDFTDGGTQQ